MSTLLCNISRSESNLYLRELMLSCGIINLLGFFDLMFSIFPKAFHLTESRSSFQQSLIETTLKLHTSVCFSDLVKYCFFYLKSASQWET